MIFFLWCKMHQSTQCEVGNRPHSQIRTVWHKLPVQPLADPAIVFCEGGGASRPAIVFGDMVLKTPPLSIRQFLPHPGRCEQCKSQTKRCRINDVWSRHTGTCLPVLCTQPEHPNSEVNSSWERQLSPGRPGPGGCSCGVHEPSDHTRPVSRSHSAGLVQTVDFDCDRTCRQDRRPACRHRPP